MDSFGWRHWCRMDWGVPNAHIAPFDVRLFNRNALMPNGFASALNHGHDEQQKRGGFPGKHLATETRNSLLAASLHRCIILCKPLRYHHQFICTLQSMNTVMDDNKMLTLASNERIPLTATMRLLLEINHMNHCSPATVSRGGVIYINAEDIGWRPVHNRIGNYTNHRIFSSICERQTWSHRIAVGSC